MQLILDHLFAVVAGAALLLTVLVMRIERSEEVRDSTRYYVAKSFQTVLADMAQRDLLNLGANMPPGAPMIVALHADSTSFYSAINGIGEPELITYRRRDTGLTVGDTPVYEVQRFVGEGPGREYTGTGLLVSRFEIAFADQGGVPVTLADAHRARIASVRIENVMPFAARDVGGAPHTMTPHRNYWEASYRPPNLAHGW